MAGNQTSCGHQGICTAKPVSGADRCWAHLSISALDAALGKLAPGSDLDLCGTTVSMQLLFQIEERLRDPAIGRLRIGTAHCHRATFAGPLDLSDVAFGGDAIFTNCTFTDNVTFAAVSFGGAANFASATFTGTATFAAAEFSSGASFADCKLTSATFTSEHVKGDISFKNARAAGPVLVSTRAADGNSALTLTGLRATGEVDVRTDLPVVRCDRAVLGGRVGLRLAGSVLWLNDSVFEQPATVESWHEAPQAQPLGHGQSASGQQTTGRRLVIIRSLRGVDAEHLTLSDVDLSRCLIYGLRRPEQLRIEGGCRFARTPRGWHLRWHFLPWRWTRREGLYEEHLRRRDSPVARLGWTTAIPAQPGDPPGPPPTPAQLAVLYRQLRRAVEDARNEPGAADLYYGEMEMRRMSTAGRGERWLLTAYWLVSGYGLRASRSLLLLGCLILAAAEALQRTGFGRHPHHPGFLDCLLYATGSVLSLNLSGHLPTALSDWGQAIRMALRVGGPVLLGLGVLAMRGRVKR